MQSSHMHFPEIPRVVYAILHHQEVFEPFKNHPNCLRIFTWFFNGRIDMQQLDGEWSVDKVLELINKHCRSWRGEEIKAVRLLVTLTINRHRCEYGETEKWLGMCACSPCA
ncbi:uncharacterized protein LOC124683623 [Lolium rigidum]|uniref:uncharacterized protein LOC124683623 n=1 Tax=Lolium rigidum TaxID=89674 RepID=UPI001F5DDA39|nr:uncharacterized protein LOC124683623 [Lolium rigidum]